MFDKLQEAWLRLIRDEKANGKPDLLFLPVAGSIPCTCPMDVTDHLAGCPAFDAHQRH